ncbi:hypothetical protein GCM10009552_16410 [Rothia nasimurium]
MVAQENQAASIPRHVQLTFAGMQQAGKHAHQGGLAAAVVTFDKGDLARMQREVERPEHGLVLAEKAKGAGFEQGSIDKSHPPIVAAPAR